MRLMAVMKTRNFCLWLLYMLALVNCQPRKWCQVDLIIRDLDLYRSCIEDRRIIRIQWSSDYDDTKTWLELAAGGWPVRVWGYWHHNQVIGMGGYSALMVMVSQWYCIHTSIHHHISVHCPIMTCCHCSLGHEDNCHVLLKLTWGPIHGRMGTPVANNFLLLLLLIHPNRNV